MELWILEQFAMKPFKNRSSTCQADKVGLVPVEGLLRFRTPLTPLSDPPSLVLHPPPPLESMILNPLASKIKHVNIQYGY